MDLAVVVALVVLQVFLQPSVAGMFTVEAEQTSYVSEYGGDVVMGCRFSSKPANPQQDLKVMWMYGKNDQDMVRLKDNFQDSGSQSPQDRVRLLADELQNGWAKLQISNLRITDAGTYQCLVQTTEGIDYKVITLSVGAPYNSVSKRIEKTEDGNEVVLICQAEGYPESPVEWQDKHLQRLSRNTTARSTPDKLFKVTSQIVVSSSEKNTYTCIFTKDGYSAKFHIPDDITLAPGKNDAVITVLCIGLILTAFGFGVAAYIRRKGSRSPNSRNCPVDDGETSMSAAACLQGDKEREVEEILTTEEENLRSHLKARYSEFLLTTKTRHHCDSFAAEELPHRLQNNDGLSARPEDLLPNAGEILLLEGPPGSGKTTVAHILLSSWADTSSSFLDVGFLDLLVYIDCGNVKDDLFSDATIQLSLCKKKSAEELRTALSQSGRTVLLLDGYKEGNRFFDKTLRRFLSERGSCSVLVTSCTGDCPMLKQSLKTEGTLKLQIQSSKY